MASMFDRIAALQELFWNATDGMVVTNADQVVVDVNPAFEELTGLPRKQWIGQKPGIVKSGKTPPEVYADMWSSLSKKGTWLGEVINRRPDGTEWVSFLSITRLRGPNGNTLGYIGISRDVTLQKQQQRELTRRLEQITALEDALVFALAEEAEFQQPDVHDHLNRVRELTGILVETLRARGCPDLADPATAAAIVRASVVHDIGKVAIPEGILLKPARLSPEEYQVMKLHSVIGAQIISEARVRIRERMGADDPFFVMAEQVTRHHHERWDGTGYPDGLAGEAIPLAARIVTVADVYDALTTRRVYKDPWPLDSVEKYILAQSGTQFDPYVVEVFRETISQFRSVASSNATRQMEQPA